MRTRVYILAGGLGTRLSHIVKDVPKPMAPVAGKPFLEWQIEWLKRQSFTDIVLLVGHMADTIESHFGDGSMFGVNIEYSYEKELLGTGGALIKALKEKNTDLFIVINGDTFYDINLALLRDEIVASSVDDIMVLALKYKDDVRRYGAVTLDDDSCITQFIEKKESLRDGLINGGIYAGRSRIFENFPEGTLSMETDIFPRLLKQKRLKGIPFEGNFIDIGVPEDFKYANDVIEYWMRDIV